MLIFLYNKNKINNKVHNMKLKAYLQKIEIASEVAVNLM